VRIGAGPSGMAPWRTMTETITREDADTRLDEPGDHDRFAHYVFGRDAGAKVTQAMVTGKPVRALCGKRWVPSRDASRYPVCPRCKEIKETLLSRR
jgi:hypothetical protein